ncbi:DUF2399 domain-containing protein [Anaeromyxobacter sp. Fw109-5]|uniref:DUF2399 domain-containing protein n=1 Tax=Anaeromyxobacter sp. (strain Fw109-5) TaxID=404589 RepID=UPI0000ED7FA9|nr:DUF2399 domain-containing protein [Anaeromyxobacter sp. Fw109-5]ABS25283.1 conserved hypothetical protein [Anaeromyxobacter sp. Fw109-5]
MNGCRLCGGACVGADLGPLLVPRLAWLWEQVAAAADRRGDPALASGILDIRAPTEPDPRAAAGGLLGGRGLRAGQSRRVDLSDLADRLRVRGPLLTPGAVAAHAMGRALATRARAEADRTDGERRLYEAFVETLSAKSPRVAGGLDREVVWAALRRNGWVARLLSAPDASSLLQRVNGVLAALPPDTACVDRRRLASDVTGDPHGLDGGTPLAGLTLAILAASGTIMPRQRPRSAWAEIGVECDDVTGGLVAVGMIPEGWNVPAGAAITLSPRVLSRCEWPRTGEGERWVFVTENPSVAAAAADLADDCDVRLLCTDGTPSRREIDAIARLAAAGWRVAVRADFDEAGLGHVAAVLAAVPAATPWRMAAGDYLSSVPADVAAGTRLDVDRLPEAPWDARLTETMRATGAAAYEEALLPLLMQDLRVGAPPAMDGAEAPAITAAPTP